MFSLIDMLGKSCPSVDVVDVGAMWFGVENVAYKGLLRNNVARVVGFEPVQAECDKLNKLGLKNHTYLPYFIGDGSERTFYLTNQSMTSSLYPPNEAFLKAFNHLHEVTTVVGTHQVSTKRLDDIPEIANVDYIKCDVQGGDLDVLKGAVARLRQAVCVQVEVEFLPMYAGQPLFAEIDTFMRAQGYVLHTLQHIQGRALKPVVVAGNLERPLNQILWSDAVFVRDFMKLAELSPEQLLKLALVVHEVYGSFDLAQAALYHYDLKKKAGLWPIYMQRLTGAPAQATPMV